MKKPRKLSAAFVQRQVDKIDAMYEKARTDNTVSPSPDEFGQVKMSYAGFRKLLKARRDLAYVEGFWAGVCLEQRADKEDPS